MAHMASSVQFSSLVATLTTTSIQLPVIYYRLEESILHLLLASWTCFSVITSQTGTYVDEIWNISDGPRCALTRKMG